jgi:AcrR family transcriptional regulator
MTHKQVKARLALLEMTFAELAQELGVTVGAVYRATRNDPFLQKLRARIEEKLTELERNQVAA